MGDTIRNIFLTLIKTEVNGGDVMMILKKNMSYVESVVRVLIGGSIIAIGLYFDSLWGLIGIIPVLSGAVSFCPIYKFLKIDKFGPNLERAN